MVVTGKSQFEKLGSMVAVGDPYQSGHSVLAVGSDTEGESLLHYMVVPRDKNFTYMHTIHWY